MSSSLVSVLDFGFVELVDYMGSDLSIVEAARASVSGKSKGTEQDKKLLRYLFVNKHTSPFEMVEFKFLVKAPIFVARQWLRHRTWSYNEQSRRYTSDDVEFYYPDSWRQQSSSNKQASTENSIDSERFIDMEYVNHIRNALDLYDLMLDNGVAREQARIVLPVSLYTTFYAKVDAHNLMHFLRLRLHEHTQKETREYAKALLFHMEKVIPWTTELFIEELRTNNYEI